MGKKLSGISIWTLWLPKKTDIIIQGERAVYLTIVIKSLVTKDMWDQFVNRLQNLLRKYPEAKVSFMGFPKDWLTVLKSI